MTVLVRHRATIVRFGKILAFTAAIFGATKLALQFAALSTAPTVAFGFLIIVLLSAFFGDILVAIATSIVATLCFDYFFLPPFGTFNIAAFSDWISLAAFLLASVMISRLTASAVENKENATALSKTLAQLKEFGEWLSVMSADQLTLTGIAKEALRVFSLEYCSIHVYAEGKWQHFTGTASTELSPETESRLKLLQDHPTDLMDLADESILGARYMQINSGGARLAVLAVKSQTLPTDAMGTMACMIGVQLSRAGGGDVDTP